MITAAENAVTPTTGLIAAPKVVAGLPGIIGLGLKVLGPVGAAFSLAALPKDIQKGEFGSALADAASFASGAMETAALGISAFGSASTAGASTALIGTGGTASGLLATAAPVVGAFGLGTAIGTGIEKTLNVSDYSSKHGAEVYEALKAHHVNETVSFAAGATASVLSIPIAIQEAAENKALQISGNLFKALYN